MTKRGVGSLVLGLAVVMGVAACDDNPLDEGRDTGAYIDVNPVNAVVAAGDTTPVIARVMSRYGTPTNDAVTAEPCDSKITAIVDPNRSAFEVPETFLVIGQTLGSSCMVVRGGGLVDTAAIRVVPATIEVTGDTLVLSGAQATFVPRFLNALGQPATGLDLRAVTFTTGSSAIAVIDSLGVLSARAPGTTPVVITLRPTSAQGVARVDTLMIRVQAGAFTGTVSLGTAGATGSTTTGLVFQQGALAFDSDTQVKLFSGAVEVFTAKDPQAAAGRIVLGLPYGLPAGTYRYEVTNIGPNQVAAAGTYTLAASLPAADPFNPDGSASTTTRRMSPGQIIFGTLDGDADPADWIGLVVTEAGNYRITANWNDNSDVDLLLRNPANTGYTSTAMATGAHPETAVVALQPGTYWIWMDMYEWAPNGSSPTSYWVTAVKQ